MHTVVPDGVANWETGMLLQRIENSAAENESFVAYFDNYIKIWEAHIVSIERNTKKFIQPMRTEHQT